MKIRNVSNKNSADKDAMRKSKVIIIIESLLLVFLILVCNVLYLHIIKGYSVMQAIQKIGQEFSFLVILLPFGFIFAALVVFISKILIRKKKL
jgi:hypothetical protein